MHLAAKPEQNKVHRNQTEEVGPGEFKREGAFSKDIGCTLAWYMS